MVFRVMLVMVVMGSFARNSLSHKVIFCHKNGQNKLADNARNNRGDCQINDSNHNSNPQVARRSNVKRSRVVQIVDEKYQQRQMKQHARESGSVPLVVVEKAFQRCPIRRS